MFWEGMCPCWLFYLQEQKCAFRFLFRCIIGTFPFEMSLVPFLNFLFIITGGSVPIPSQGFHLQAHNFHLVQQLFQFATFTHVADSCKLVQMCSNIWIFSFRLIHEPLTTKIGWMFTVHGSVFDLKAYLCWFQVYHPSIRQHRHHRLEHMLRVSSVDITNTFLLCLLKQTGTNQYV